MKQQVSRAIVNRKIILGSELIPTEGFGSIEVTRVTPDGQRLTEVASRCFTGCCGHLICDENQAGPMPCPGCLQELVHGPQAQALREHLTPAELRWRATPCLECAETYACSFDFCRRSGCGFHFAQPPDGPMLCLEHYFFVSEELEIAESQQKYGRLLTSLSRGCKGFLTSLTFIPRETR